MIVGGERWLTVAEAAAWFDVSENTIRSWRNRRNARTPNAVRSVTYGGRLLISSADLAAVERDTRGKYARQRQVR